MQRVWLVLGTGAGECTIREAEICRYDVRRDDRADSGWRLPPRTEMVVLRPIEHFHLPLWAADRLALAGVCLSLVSKGARIRSKWPQTKGTEGRPPEQGVRGDFHDRGQRLGWRAHFRSNYNRTYPCKSGFHSYLIFWNTAFHVHHIHTRHSFVIIKNKFFINFSFQFYSDANLFRSKAFRTNRIITFFNSRDFFAQFFFLVGYIFSLILDSNIISRALMWKSIFRCIPTMWTSEFFFRAVSMVISSFFVTRLAWTLRSTHHSRGTSVFDSFVISLFYTKIHSLQHCQSAVTAFLLEFWLTLVQTIRKYFKIRVPSKIINNIKSWMLHSNWDSSSQKKRIRWCGVVLVCCRLNRWKFPLFEYLFQQENLKFYLRTLSKVTVI